MQYEMRPVLVTVSHKYLSCRLCLERRGWETCGGKGRTGKTEWPAAVSGPVGVPAAPTVVLGTLHS